ncbi:unnamed protein product [Clonostachys rosea f. rosea IK726]|uniref:Uncharacterized protein n=2 Tax=Clonostachys rosea f. rosea IK726 TaxID=1349383 RepID=A0ACA9UL35_BIOOC|nr:unnamed protein product [Clonostachys rosea f. rosea IK726]CAG9953774.1 unnamed protein product [Clonostachys rosea f. rosea IK726]
MAGGFEFLRTRSNSSWGVEALGSIMMTLMQGYVKDDGVVGVDNLDRWRTDSRAVEFLSATTYVNDMNQLLKWFRPGAEDKDC